MFCAILSVGCGGGSDFVDSEQTETLNEDTGDYDPNEEARGNSGSSGEISIHIGTASSEYVELMYGTERIIPTAECSGLPKIPKIKDRMEALISL